MKLMEKNSWSILWRAARWSLAIAIAFVLSGDSALAATAQEIDRDVTAALQALYANTPGAQDLGNQAKGGLMCGVGIQGSKVTQITPD